MTGRDTPTTTEHLHHDACSLDLTRPTSVLQELLNGQLRAAEVVTQSLASIANAAQAAATSIRSGRQLAYVGAGSSGLIAVADGLELPGTFGIPAEQISLIVAGGVDSLSRLSGKAEDTSATTDIESSNLTAGDCAICISASGTTTYTVSALRTLTSRGVTTIGIANNPATPILSEANIAIDLPTPPELVAGSTRMGAGTAQKITLNLISTLMSMHLGHVHEGHMVSLHPDNAKLRRRANRMISTLTGCTQIEAQLYLTRASGSVKIAILLATGATDPATALALLESNGGILGSALDDATNRTDPDLNITDSTPTTQTTLET